MSATVSLRFDGMTCAACVLRVARVLTRVVGIEAAADVVVFGKTGTVAFSSLAVMMNSLRRARRRPAGDGATGTHASQA